MTKRTAIKPARRSTDHTRLRRRAESRLRRHQPKPGSRRSETDTVRVLHELEVHQIELELQNAELRRTRDELEAALDNYTDLYDFAPVGYFTLAATGTINQVNLTGANLVNVERSRLVGRHFELLLPGDLRPAFNTFLNQVFLHPARRSGDFAILRAGQPPRIVNIEAQRLVSRQECRAAVVDITERQRAEETVRISEVRYRRLFEAAHDGVLLLDPGTRQITDANPFMIRLLGYPHDQLVGKELFEIGLLKDEAASRAMFQELKRNHGIRYENLPLESREGRHQEVEVVANLYQENGRAVIQCNIRDITERKQAEEMLRRNEALFSALVEQAPVGVYVVDAAFRLKQLNPTAQQVFKKVFPLIDRDFAQILRCVWPDRVADGIVKHFRHTLKTGQPYQSPEFTARRRDLGVQEIYEWQIQRVTLPAGEHGVVCFFNNITARKRAEDAQRRLDVLTASNRKLEQEIARRRTVEESLRKSEQHQRQLVAQSQQMQAQLRQLSRKVLWAQEEERRRISRELHDVIAQTLAGINVRLATLKRGVGANTKDFDRHLTRTQMLVEKSVTIVHQFARELRPAVLDDLGLIPALHSFLKNFTAQTGIRAQLRAFTGIEKLDATKRTVLFRVAQEALTNVARHAQTSRVEVSIQKLPDGICLKVKDAGKSFNVVQTLRANRGRHLGLLGMRERLEMVGGHFEVMSAPGKGTTITAQIPFEKFRGGGASGVR